MWWNYLGGALGLIFVGLGAYLITQVGVLVTAMGMIAGQLVGSWCWTSSSLRPDP
ncbi:DMT family transporter [Nesterenkonia pannonica]|uniref:DMT family transporter n=1 Tax=Nesterenkonia pannonica TaxID=1548602 RepID=UPI002164A00E|nr:DMT family transporter [Nesterenkonia pannonica]